MPGHQEFKVQRPDKLGADLPNPQASRPNDNIVAVTDLPEFTCVQLVSNIVQLHIAIVNAVE